MDKGFISEGYARYLRRLLNSSIEGWRADGKKVVRGAQVIAECRSENEAELIAKAKEALLPALNEVVRLSAEIEEVRRGKAALAKTVSKQHRQITKSNRGRHNKEEQ